MADKKLMKAVEISSPGGPDTLVACKRPIPSPAGSEVLIRIDAAGVNRPDILQRMGLYPPPPGATDIPGLEAAGVISAVGPEVQRWRVGEPVCALLPGGGYAEFAVVDEGSCLPLPNGISPEEAAGLPETVFTVWANVFDAAALKPGETLLVHGGTSGIGVTAISLAKAFGAKVIATASSDEKCAAILDQGATAAFRYDSPGWEDKIRTLGGADVVLDMAGGDFVRRNLAVMNAGGRHVSIGFQRGPEAAIDIMAIMRKRLTITGSTMKARDAVEKSRLAAAIENAVWPLIEAGAFRPVVDRVFPLADAAEAHRRMEAGEHVGKIILTMH
ncbi:MAG: zinc-binding dehydrogenase [Alphaproteobacteria bacterium]|nr:zinc-binding dehydrogenase [Alphaproteobacteria bacterium]